MARYSPHAALSARAKKYIFSLIEKTFQICNERGPPWISYFRVHIALNCLLVLSVASACANLLCNTLLIPLLAIDLLIFSSTLLLRLLLARGHTSIVGACPLSPICIASIQPVKRLTET